MVALSAPGVGLAQNGTEESGAPATEAPKAGDPAAAAAVDLAVVIDEQMGADAEARASQERINQIDDETQQLLAEYRRAIADTESFHTYAEQLEAQIHSQEDEMASIRDQLDEIEVTSRAIVPLMKRMLGTLEQFVSLDVPFLIEERNRRVAVLKEMMPRADVTISEKYRRILEAYQVELDYGRTIESYEGTLGQGDDARTVQFLRVGRVSLLYQTLDGKETGYWDQDSKRWIVDDDYSHGFREGIAVAKKLRAPEMLMVPVPAPQQSPVGGEEGTS